jgi:type I restriction enzyme M protein
VSDGSLLFLMHLISKLRDAKEGGARIGIILNGSPLFTGGAGSGESEIRRYILEADLLEAIAALPTDMFYNTGIATYIWVLSNKKSKERKGKVQLINAVNLYEKMRKSLGSKRNMLGDEDIAAITRCFGNFESVETTDLDKPAEVKSNRGRQSENGKTESPKTFACKIFDHHEFGYRRITVERPLRESYQFSDERIEELRFAQGALNAPMKWVYEKFKDEWKTYGDLSGHETEIRKHLKKSFENLKEKQLKDLLSPKTWKDQLDLLNKAEAIQKALSAAQYDDMNGFDEALNKTGVKLDTNEKKQIQAAVSWKNPEAAKVIKKVHKKKAHPLYGLFEDNKKTVEYQSDSDLRDNENIPLDPSRPVKEVIEEYFKKEVLPHVPEAWIDAGKTDPKDGEIGLVGYEIPFNRHFYVYKPPRPLEEIDADLDKVSEEIMNLLREVHS